MVTIVLLIVNVRLNTDTMNPEIQVAPVTLQLIAYLTVAHGLLKVRRRHSWILQHARRTQRLFISNVRCKNDLCVERGKYVNVQANMSTLCRQILLNYCLNLLVAKQKCGFIRCGYPQCGNTSVTLANAPFSSQFFLNDLSLACCLSEMQRCDQVRITN